jgi:hypothetical protein
MKKLIIPALALMPFLASAQELGNVSRLLTSVGTLINTALPIVVGLALLGFFWGLAMFVFNAHNEEKRGEGRSIMIWGVVALFVMVAVWGLVNFVGSALNITTGTASPTIPRIPGTQ